jgi:UDP-N-acetyl-2-amino-2-deoxyglucuronate dehydrogenase
MDSYFPNANFFTEIERFDRQINKLKRKGEPIDFILICLPNYLHDAHFCFSLKCECVVISEKPLVINPWNVDALQEIEAETGT